MDNKQITKQVHTALIIISGNKLLSRDKTIDKITENDLDSISRTIEKEFESWWLRNDADSFYYQSFLTWLTTNYKNLIKGT